MKKRRALAKTASFRRRDFPKIAKLLEAAVERQTRRPFPPAPVLYSEMIVK
jgi:hypothetical protein